MECMQILLAKGADVNCPEAKSGKSSLHLAVQTGSVEVVTSLLRWVRFLTAILKHFNLVYRYYTSVCLVLLLAIDKC